MLAYDGLSRWARITEYSGNAVTADRRFVYNETSLVEERDWTGTNVVKRFFANGFWQQGTNYYYLTDQLGSIREVTLVDGTVVARFEYDPWGRRTQTLGTLWVDFGFTGLFELPNGFKLAVWRVYDPSTGRWLSRDPIREAGGWNLYAYCSNLPNTLADPRGLTVNKAVDLNRFSLFDSLYYTARQLAPEPSVYVVAGHGPSAMGSPYIVDDLSVDALAAMILSAKQKGVPFDQVRLVTCFTDRVEQNHNGEFFSKAQLLADKIKMPVIATAGMARPAPGRALLSAYLNTAALMSGLIYSPFHLSYPETTAKWVVKSPR